LIAAEVVRGDSPLEVVRGDSPLEVVRGEALEPRTASSSESEDFPFVPFDKPILASALLFALSEAEGFGTDPLIPEE
jgi:hypothetical protein